MRASLTRAEKIRDQVEQNPMHRDHQPDNRDGAKDDASHLVSIAYLLYAKVHESHAEHDFNQS